MNLSWQSVPLKQALKRVARFESREDINEYVFAGTYSFGRGVFVSERKLGATFKLPKVQRLRAGDFVYCKIMAWEGAFGIVPPEADDCVMSNAFVAYEADSSVVDPKFLDWYFRAPSNWQRIGRQSTGTNVRRQSLHPEQFEASEIPLPPLGEQRRIVARIEKLAARVQEAQQARLRAVNELSALHTKLLLSTFDSVSNSSTEIGAEFVVTTGGTPSRANSSYWGGSNAWVSSGEVAFRDIIDTREKITDLGLRESNAKIYPPGTVLLAMIGQGKTRGQCAILQCAAATNQNVAAIHVTKTIHSPRYVYWWLYANYRKSRSTETGTAQPALSADRVKRMLIPLPERNRQDQIASQLEALQSKFDAVKALQAQSAIELDALLPAVLDKAFKGEL